MIATTITVTVGLLVGLAVRRWLVTPMLVESSSMEPTLVPGQRLMMRRLRGVRHVSRGDLVLVDSAEAGRIVVKRAVGLPGERVRVAWDGRVQIDGVELDEPYARRAFGPAGTFAVPPRSLFLLGDNRRLSGDSRTWRQPFVPADAVLGKVVRTRS